jgi:hypothetical protein
VFLAAGGRTGVAKVGDVVVTIEAADEETILAAARAR